MREKIRLFVEGDFFNTFILVLIILNAILIGVDTFDISPGINSFLFVLDCIILFIFVLEMLMKIFAYGVKGFFKNGWNVFDFIVIFTSLLTFSGLFSSTRIVRIIRIIRVLRVSRLISSVRKLKLLVDAMVASVSSVIWACVLLLIVDYIYSLIGTSLFSKISPEYFGNLWKSFYTLFQLMIADDIGNITRPILSESPFSFIYFVSFVIITIMLILNVIVGIMVGSLEDIRKKNTVENEKTEGDSILYEIRKLKREIEILEIIAEKKELGSTENKKTDK